MRPTGTPVGTRFGPVSAIGSQPRRCREIELRAGTPTAPWGSRRLPRTLFADDAHRTRFRSLLRRAEGVPVELSDGTVGVVDTVELSPLGFDFWPEALVLATRAGRRRIPARSVRRIDVREPRIWGDAPSARAFEERGGGRHERHPDEQGLHRLQRRDDLVQVRMLARRRRQRAEASVGRS